MDESILESVKKILGLTSEYTHFDTDLIIHINTILMVLYQMGYGDEPFSICDDSTTWDDYLQDNTDLAAIKTYLALRVRLLFDPPNSSVAQAIQQQLDELQWRIFITVDKEGLNE